jgi:hypothetical protein
MFCFNGASNPLPFLIAHEHHFKNKQVIWLPFSEVILKSLKEIFQKSKAVVIEKVTAETKPKRPKDFEAHECLSEKFDVIKCTLLTGNSAEEKAKNIDLKTILDASDLDGYRPEGYLG